MQSIGEAASQTICKPSDENVCKATICNSNRQQRSVQRKCLISLGDTYIVAEFAGVGLENNVRRGCLKHSIQNDILKILDVLWHH